MGKKFETTIIKASKELTVKEEIKLKDISDAISIDTASQEADFNGSKLRINVLFYAVLSIHNEAAKDKDYDNILIIAKNEENPNEWGERYTTGSTTFIEKFEEIYGDMTEAGEEEIVIEVIRKDSKNYAGRQFITCTVV